VVGNTSAIATLSHMSDFQSFLAPAKINLFLHITGQRPDGYHNLQSVFQLLDYADTVNIKPTKDGNIKRKTDIAGVPEDQDLCIRAARALQAASNCKLGAEIEVEKRIPMGGGLGGGSSNAATVLLALNHLWGLHMDRQQLIAIGLKLGADVPVFIFGQNAWAEGIGEILTPITLATQHFVVLTPAAHVSTAQIFAHSGLTKDTKTLKIFVAVDSAEEANAIYAKKPTSVNGFVAKGLSQHPLYELTD